ncbi:MAG: hypothetical protein R8P61_20570 [Bacteroidia bacterium]|nr:hypothetical protein [Bacteroidia bacterium]
MMEIQLEKLKFREIHIWMDGGSITLNFRDEKDKELMIELQQSATEEYLEEISKIPGRIYFDEKVIEKRSSEEEQILEYLKERIINKLEVLERRILEDQIRWIESPKYLEFQPRKMNRRRKIT